MAPLPAINVAGCDPNMPLVAKAMSRSSNSHRQSSLKHPMRSSTSRISLVGDNASLERKIDVMHGTTNNAKEFGWFDHLLGAFCIARRSRFESVQTTVSIRAPEYNEREDYFDSRSPWVLPVYVLSTERDEYRHLIPKEAKCTIDTGNLQGNLVSRAFLVDVLRYSEADFHELTKGEEDGGTGITGHRLIPEGTISLTWYHSNSTRVFRDMRFLISEHPIYDLIIGAHSIRQNNILDVPNLMADQDPAGIVLSTDPLKARLTHEKFAWLKKLQAAMNKANAAWSSSIGEEEETEVAKREATFEIEKAEFHNAYRAEYKNLIWAAEQKDPKDKKGEIKKLREEYSGWFPNETLETPLQLDKDKKDN